MKFRLVRKPNKDCKIFWMILILIVCLCLIFKTMYKQRKNEFFNNKKYKTKKTNLDPSYNLGVCSKNCCATQWEVPIDLTERSKVNIKDIGKKYFRSNLTCNNGILNTGCVCLTKESRKLLNNKGYVKQIPIANGLLDADNRKSVWQLKDNLIDKPTVLGQTTQLTGKPNEQIIISGLVQDKKSKHSSIDYDKDISANYTIPINNNMIQWDNDLINYTLLSSSNYSDSNFNKSENSISKPILKSNTADKTVKATTEKLLKNRLGTNTSNKNIK